MRVINEIIVHCTATEAGKDFKAADVRRWHTAPPPKGRGWKDIGYHFVVDLDGTVECGRPVEQKGAHCSDHNATTIGVCYVGGLKYDKPADTRTEAQKRSLAALIGVLKSCFPSIAKVSGHRDYANKACPCFDAKAEYDHLVK